jgi:alcohol dehydrogenase
MEDYWGANMAAKPMLPSIGIPTTAGTGSEAQSYALISQEGTHRKMACGDRKARFKGIILDPLLTLSLPKTPTAVSGIDAISHAVESYVTTSSNLVSRMFSAEAWRILDQNYERVLNDPENVEARGAMLLGSYLAGTAIEFSMLGAAHACANPLTERFDILHGVAVSLMLPHVIRFNSSTVDGSYAELLAASGKSGNRNAETLSRRIVELKSSAMLPARLRDCGVDQKLLPELAIEACEQWTGKFNPRPVAEKEFLELYENAY